MDFAAIPPEINSARMYSGPGSGPMLAAATTWDRLAGSLRSTETSYGSEISDLTTGWRGPASASMASATAPYLGWMSATAAQAEQAAGQAKAAAGAYETAFALTVPPPVIAANRALLMSLIATNILGQNTPAIAATEAHYAEMWAQDAAAMYGYADSSAAASTFTPFTQPPPATNAAAPVVQGAAVTQAAGTSAGAGTQATLSQLVTAIPQALQGLASPTSSTSGLGGILGLGSGSSTSGLGGILDLLAGNSSSTTGLSGLFNDLFSSQGLGLNDTLWNTIFSSGFYMPSNTLGAFTSLMSASAAADAAEGLGEIATGGLGSGALGGLGGLGGVGGVAAGVGHAATIGPLSVPPSWTAPVGAAASALQGGGLGASPAIGGGGPASMLGGMPLTAPTGNGLNGAAPRYGFRPTVIAHPPAAG